MRTQFFSTCAMTILLSAPVLADEPVELTAQQMDQITAGAGQGNAGKVAWFAGGASAVISGDSDGALFHNFGGGALNDNGGGAGGSGGVFVPDSPGHI